MTASQLTDASGDSSDALGYRSKTDLVTAHLREQLQKGRPAAGQRLVVARVAEELGVSKVPVREAVRRLAGEGLLELRPNVGPVVPSFSAHEVTETALLRASVEELALRHAIEGHTEETLQAAGDLIAEMGRPEADFPTLNVRFHLSLLDPCPYREVVALAGSLLQRAQRYATVLVVPAYRAEAHAEHQELLELARAQDLGALLQLNRHHIINASERLIQQLT